MYACTYIHTYIRQYYTAGPRIWNFQLLPNGFGNLLYSNLVVVLEWLTFLRDGWWTHCWIPLIWEGLMQKRTIVFNFFQGCEDEYEGCDWIVRTAPEAGETVEEYCEHHKGNSMVKKCAKTCKLCKWRQREEETERILSESVIETDDKGQLRNRGLGCKEWSFKMSWCDWARQTDWTTDIQIDRWTKLQKNTGADRQRSWMTIKANNNLAQTQIVKQNLYIYGYRLT